MNDSASARTAIRRIPGLLVAGLLLAIAATVGALGYQSPARSSSNAASSIYANEPWHCELRLEAIDHGCPPMYGDPTHDPRMQQ